LLGLNPVCSIFFLFAHVVPTHPFFAKKRVYGLGVTRTSDDDYMTKTIVIEENGSSVQAEYPNRYAPIPPNGKRCEFTGLKHSKLYHILCAGGPVRRKVRVANLRSPGANRGQTLFHVGDMLRYLDELASHHFGEAGSVEQ
jgi:hypothetical protein